MPLFAASDTPYYQQSHVTTIVKADERSGHLVRSATVKPTVIMPRNPEAPEPAAEASSAPVAAAIDPTELVAMIDRIAAEQGVEESLVHSVIRAESNYNPYAVSSKGAQGLMQLIPSTAKRFGVSNAFDVADNVLGGVKYLKFLLDYYQNDYVRTIAAYNAGEAAVDKYNGIPPYNETRNYVSRVAQNLKTARASRISTAKAEAAPAAVTDNRETFKRIEASVGSDGRIYYRTP